MKSFTVLGIRPSHDWGDGLYAASFVTYAEAETPAQVASMVRHQMASSEEGRVPGDYLILGVFEGHVPDVYDPEVDTSID